MTGQMEVLLKEECRPEAEEMFQMLSEMSLTEQKEMLVFMRGARFACGLERKRVDAPAV